MLNIVGVAGIDCIRLNPGRSFYQQIIFLGNLTMNNLIPEVSAWYKDVANGSLFEVVAYDEQSGTVEYQHVDGEVGEYDTGSWQELSLIPAEPPEDWRSPYEVNSEDDSYSDHAIVPENWSGALSDIEPDSLDFGDDFQVL